MTHLEGIPYVDAVGVVGVCTSAGNAVHLAAEDPSVKALATIAGFLVTPDVFAATYGEEGVAQRREQAVAARQKYDRTGEQTFITVYSETDPTAANHNPVEGAYDYYDTPEQMDHAVENVTRFFRAHLSA